jgi:hypothetical protein
MHNMAIMAWTTSGSDKTSSLNALVAAILLTGDVLSIPVVNTGIARVADVMKFLRFMIFYLSSTVLQLWTMSPAGGIAVKLIFLTH